MKWIKIEDRNNARSQLPLDRPFVAMWKGAFSICEFDEDKDKFYISYLPAQFEASCSIDKEAECKFSYWGELEFPQEWLDNNPIGE